MAVREIMSGKVYASMAEARIAIGIKSTGPITGLHFRGYFFERVAS